PAARPRLVPSQRLPFDEVHRVPRQTSLHALRDDADDARMPHARERVDLATDAAEVRRVRHTNGLQRDPFAGLVVGRAIHDAHAALRDRRDDAVAADSARLEARDHPISRPLPTSKSKSSHTAKVGLIGPSESPSSFAIGKLAYASTSTANSPPSRPPPRNAVTVEG